MEKSTLSPFAATFSSAPLPLLPASEGVLCESNKEGEIKSGADEAVSAQILRASGNSWSIHLFPYPGMSSSIKVYFNELADSTPRSYKYRGSLHVVTPIAKIEKCLFRWMKQIIPGEGYTRGIVVGTLRQFLKNKEQNTLKLFSRTLTQLPHIFHLQPFVDKLQHLIVSLPNLKVAPSGLFSLKSLVTLHMRFIPIQTILSHIASLSQLQVLDLRETDVAKLPSEVFSLTQLKMLDISNTKVKEISPLISKLVNLEHLELQATRIKKLPSSLCTLAKLRTLACTASELEELPVLIGKIASLEQLYLGYTKIAILPISMRSLKRLNVLIVHHTPLTTFFRHIQGWSASQIVEQSALWHIPKNAYFVTNRTLHISIERETFPLLAKEHLYRLAKLLKVHSKKELSCYVTYKNEPAVDYGGPSREYMGNLLIHAIAEDLEEYRERSLFVPLEEENGLYHLSCRYEEMSLKQVGFCWNLGVFLSAFLTGFCSERQCNIGMVFSRKFYFHLLILCVEGQKVFPLAPVVSLATEKQACLLLSAYDPDFYFYKVPSDVGNWNIQQLTDLLHVLYADEEISKESQAQHAELINRLEACLSSKKLEEMQPHLCPHQKYIDAKREQTAVSQYTSIVKPLLFVAQAFKDGKGERSALLRPYLEEFKDLKRASREAFLALQGSPVTHNALLAVLARSSCAVEVQKQFNWIQEAITEGSTTQEQMENMLACMTGAAAITEDLSLVFYSYDDKEDVCKTGIFSFSVCSNQVMIPESLLDLDKNAFLAYWYGELEKTLKFGYSMK